MAFPILGLLPFAEKLVERIFPDPATAAEAKLKLVELEQNGQLAMIAAETDLAKIDADDRNSARQREMTVKDKMPSILAIGVSVGFFGVLAYMLKYGVPSEGRDVLIYMTGTLGATWTAIIAYYFGSSSGSTRKTQLMADMVNK